MELHYKITTKNKMSVVVFTGSATREDGPVLDACLAELLKDSSTQFVIFLKDITHFEVPLMREFTIFQNEIRKNHPDIFIVINHAATRQTLLDKAIVRASEVKKSIEEVLEILLKKS